MADKAAYLVSLPYYENGTEVCACPSPSPPPTPTDTSPVLLVFDTRNPCGQGASDAMGQWYVWRPPGTPVASCMHQGTYHYLDQDGTVRYEVPDQAYDDNGTQILPKIHFAPLFFTQLGEVKRVFRVHTEGKWGGSHSLKVTAVIAESKSAEPSTWTRTFTTTDDGRAEFQFEPMPGRMQSIELTFEEVASAYNTAGYKLRSLGFEMGTDGKMRRLNNGQRL